jgi:hypothetical protein
MLFSFTYLSFSDVPDREAATNKCGCFFVCPGKDHRPADQEAKTGYFLLDRCN